MILKNHKAKPYEFKKLEYDPNILRDLVLTPQQEKDSLEYLAITTEAKFSLGEQFTPIVLSIWTSVYRHKIQVDTLMSGIKKYGYTPKPINEIIDDWI